MSGEHDEIWIPGSPHIEKAGGQGGVQDVIDLSTVGGPSIERGVKDEVGVAHEQDSCVGAESGHCPSV